MLDYLVKCKSSICRTASIAAYDGVICILASGAVLACCGLIVTGKTLQATEYTTKKVCYCGKYTSAVGTNVACTTASTTLTIALAPAKCGLWVVRKAFNTFQPSKASKGQNDSNVVNINATSHDFTATGQDSETVPMNIPKHYQPVSEHESRWLQAYYNMEIDFWRPFTVQPDALKCPRLRKQLAIVIQSGVAQRSDLNTLSFAKFVCEKKNLPYSGLACLDVLRDEVFASLKPPV